MDRHFARYYNLYFWALIILGATQSLLYAMTVIRHPDHIQLLYKGVQLAHFHNWIPYGNLVTGGGAVPGGLSALLIGLPLMIYDGMLSVNILILIFHLLALWCLNEVLKDSFSPLQRLCFVALFWLTPWRASKAVIWNPSYLYFATALHLWSAHKMTKSKSFWVTGLHVFSIGFAFQLHASSIILAFVSIYLYIRRHIKVSYTGLVSSVGLVALTLVPYYLELQTNPALMPVVESSNQKFFYGKSLVYIYPFLKGILYWARYTSLMFPKFVYSGLDFSFLGEEVIRNSVRMIFNGVKHILGVLSMGLSVWSLLWLVKRIYQRKFNRYKFKSFIDNYVLATFLAMCMVTAISPLEFSHWHLMLVLPISFISFLQFLIEKNWKFQSRALVWIVIYLILFNFTAALSSRDHSWTSNLTQEYPAYRDEQLAR